MYTISTPIRVILADEVAFFKDGFRLMLRNQKENRIKMVAEAANDIELLEKVNIHQPDIVITHIRMPGMDGIELTKLIKSKYPKIGIIALSMYEEESMLIDMLQAGALGFLQKKTDKDEIIKAIKTVHSGNPYYCSSVASILFRDLVSRGRYYDHAKKAEFSFSEINIIQMLCKEFTSKEIAERLKLRTRTVEDYRHKIQEKIGAKNSAGIIMYAIKNELVLLNEPKTSN